MTLTQLRADLYRRLGFASSPGTDVQTRLTAFLNEAQQEVLSLPGMEYLLRATTTFASVANTQTYAPLAASTGRILTVRETTNDRVLDPLSLGTYRRLYPDPAAITGTPVWWVPLGLLGAHTQPSNGSQLFVKSTSASDAGTATIEGVLATGNTPFSETVTMAGTTAVGTLQGGFAYVTKFYVSAAAAGRITLHEDSGTGTELALIGPGETSLVSLWFALAPTPSSAVTYSVDYELNVPDMSNANDRPVLPLKFHRLLLAGARMREWERQEKMELYLAAKADYERGVKDLQYWVFSQTAGTPNLRGSASVVDLARQRLTAW